MITKTLVGTSATLISSAKDRSMLIVYNVSDTDVFIAIEGSPDVTDSTGARPGLKVAAGASFGWGGSAEHKNATDQAIYAISTASNKAVVVQEF